MMVITPISFDHRIGNGARYVTRRDQMHLHLVTIRETYQAGGEAGSVFQNIEHLVIYDQIVVVLTETVGEMQETISLIGIPVAVYRAQRVRFSFLGTR